MRTWLEKHAGIACVAASEILMLALVVMPHDGQITTTVAGIGIVSASLLGFGVGWIVRDERGRK